MQSNIFVSLSFTFLIMTLIKYTFWILHAVKVSSRFTSPDLNPRLTRVLYGNPLAKNQLHPFTGYTNVTQGRKYRSTGPYTATVTAVKHVEHILSVASKRKYLLAQLKRQGLSRYALHCGGYHRRSDCSGVCWDYSVWWEIGRTGSSATMCMNRRNRH